MMQAFFWVVFALGAAFVFAWFVRTLRLILARP